MNDGLWNFAVRKPLWWFLRRFLKPEQAQPVLDQIEGLVALAIAQKDSPLAQKG